MFNPLSFHKFTVFFFLSFLFFVQSCSKENHSLPSSIMTQSPQKIQLKKGVPQTVFGMKVEFQGIEVKFFDPPMETRSRTYFTFLTTYKGVAKTLKYSEGFPGDLSPKPRLEIAPLTYVTFDWEKYSGLDIDMVFKIDKQKEPKKGLHEFPQCSVQIEILGSTSVWKKESMEEFLKLYPEEMKESLRKTFRKLKLKNYKISVTDHKSKKEHVFEVPENVLFIPSDITAGKLDYQVILHKIAEDNISVSVVESQ